MNRQTSLKRKIRYRLLHKVAIVFSLLVLLTVQLQSAYASSCNMTMTVDNVEASHLSDDSHNDVPPCHQQQAKISDELEEQTSKTDNNCCAEQCTCIKGGGNTMAFIPIEPLSRFAPTLSSAPTFLNDNLLSTPIQNLLRPPIS